MAYHGAQELRPGEAVIPLPNDTSRVPVTIRPAAPRPPAPRPPQGPPNDKVKMPLLAALVFLLGWLAGMGAAFIIVDLALRT